MSKPNEKIPEERRKYVRIKKNFILSYSLKKSASIKYDITQLKNISQGGMCFITTQKYERGTQLTIDLRTPYFADVTIFEGAVLESHEKLKNIIYETRIQFEQLSPQSEFLLKKLEEFFLKEQAQGGSSHEQD